MKIKLNEALKSFDMFQMNEESVEVEVKDVDVAPEAEVDSQKTSIIADVDNIITSLETLAGQVTESLEEELNEVKTGTLVNAFNYMVVAPRARKAQKKVNQMRYQIQDMEFAMSNETDDKVKDKLRYKIETSKEQVEQLEDSISDRYDNQSDIAMRARKNEKIKGNIEIAKRATGMNPSDAEKTRLKKRLAKLSDTLEKEEKALKEMEPNRTEQEELNKRIEADRAKKKAAASESLTESFDFKGDLLNRAAALNNEELVNTIASKEAWQLNNTTLQKNIEVEIKKQEAQKTLQDNKYSVDSVKDAFSKLI